MWKNTTAQRRRQESANSQKRDGEDSKKQTPLQTILPAFALSRAPPYQPTPNVFRGEEYTYRAIRDYFENRLSVARWLFKSPTGRDMATAEGVAGSKQWSEFFERFRVAIPLIQNRTSDRATEGVKMIRICFAEVASVLRYEDPGTVFAVLSIVRLLRLSGNRLDALSRQLLEHFAALAAEMRHPTVYIWMALLRNLKDGILDNYRSLKSLDVVSTQMAHWLGPDHAKTIEMKIFAMSFDDDDVEKKVVKFQAMLAGLEARSEFDARHAAARMNLAALFFHHGRLDKSAELILAVLNDPEKKRVIGNRPSLMYNFLWRIGHIGYVQKQYGESEMYFRQALEVARGLSEKGESSYLLECLVSLESCLRDQGQIEEAQDRLLERKSLVRATLTKVGEIESSVQ